MKKKKKAIDELINGGIAMFAFYIYLKTDWRIGLITFAILYILYIVFILIKRIHHQQKVLKSGITEIDKMTGKQFEYYLSQILTKQGHKVKVTKTTGDFGADLILMSPAGKSIVVQAKRYQKNVGIKAVQEIVAAVPHYGASESWVVTNSFYTTAAIKLAKSNNVQLYNRDDLIEWILQTDSKSSIAS